MKRLLVYLLALQLILQVTYINTKYAYAVPYEGGYKDEAISGNYLKITVKKPVDFTVKNDKDQRIVVKAFGRGKFSGYDVRFRSGTRSWKTYRVITTSNLRHKFVGLNKNWQYQVQVRAVRDVDGTYYPSRWTKKLVVTIEK